MQRVSPEAFRATFFEHARSTTYFTRQQKAAARAPPSTFHFNYTKSSSERATLLCEVDGAFPMPHLKMYRLLPDTDDDKAELVNVQLTTERKDGLYRAAMTSEVLDASLPQDEDTVFLCSYTFKEIKYHRFQRLVYTPGPKTRYSTPWHEAASWHEGFEVHSENSVGEDILPSRS
ncbi:hypothetical protein HPB51_015178 [Rhipicephalus microplus]|uniref:Uncharacterized protein n=1 Tax=Rhipicephalus microplus TaxID=6941 RepID=A0A9J6DPB1_RHIMP|nr:hypothetical protein HPB51_015178 [Rhipicephalus microplus]